MKRTVSILFLLLANVFFVGSRGCAAPPSRQYAGGGAGFARTPSRQRFPSSGPRLPSPRCVAPPRRPRDVPHQSGRGGCRGAPRRRAFAVGRCGGADRQLGRSTVGGRACTVCLHGARDGVPALSRPLAPGSAIGLISFPLSLKHSISAFVSDNAIVFI